MRIYNGCPDNELKARFDEEDKLFKKVRKYYPEVKVTYFPLEAKFHVHSWGNSLSKMCDTKLSALHNALLKLRIEEKKNETKAS